MGKKIHPVARAIVNIAARGTRCGIQYNGCPCNTCFHTWAEDELKLSPDLSHMFWLVVLALRGDYTCEELIEGNVGNFLAIATQYMGKKKKPVKKQIYGKTRKRRN